MKPNAKTTQGCYSFRTAYAIVGLIVSLPVFFILGITSYLRLSSESTALRDTVVKSAPERWHKKFAVNVGWLTTGVVRAGLSRFKLDPDARAAIGAVRSFEVGLYDVDQPPSGSERATILARADKAMTARGWERMVGVGHQHEMVAIYVPARAGSAEDIKCCLMVLQERQLIVASLRGNLETIVQVAQSHGSRSLEHLNLAMH